MLEEKIKQYDAVLLNELPREMTDDIIKYCFFHAIRVYFTPRVEDIIVRETEAINLFDSPLFLNKNIVPQEKKKGYTEVPKERDRSVRYHGTGI